jgi:3,4-dihydroxy 2-butanone 4-phosphate synthase / GTP cyclohydrolase II
MKVIEQELNKLGASLATTAEIIDELRRGRPVIIVDDEDRENEGDLVIPAEHVTEEWMAFTIRYTGGVVCLAMSNQLADHFELNPMVECNTSPLKTAFTVSIEARTGVTTGISAKDRVTTIRATLKPGAGPRDLVRPGHVFPLRARDRGVLERRGHTEAAVDLCRLAGLQPAGAISELMHDDGTMMRLPALLEFGRTHGLKVGTIADLIEYRLKHEAFVKRVAESRLPLESGEFRVLGFEDALDDGEHLALTLGDVTRPAVLVRIHPECIAGNTLGSLRCECGARWRAALQRIAAEGHGVFVYRRARRELGLSDQIDTCALDQPQAAPQRQEGAGAASLREFASTGQILRALGVGSVRLIGESEGERESLEAFGIRVVDCVPLLDGAPAREHE